MDMRPYQNRMLEEGREHLRAGVKSILFQSATGSGKTCLAATMLGTASHRGHRCWFACHRAEILRQSIRTFAKVGIPFGVISAGMEADRRPLVQIASVQTLARRHERLEKPRLIVWDEAHHVAAKSWADLHAAYPDAIHIGLSATPERLDGTGLGKWFERMIRGPSVASLIADGYLAPYRLFAPASVDLSAIHTRGGDFAKDELSKEMDKPSITGDAIDHYRRLAAGKRAVVFCTSIEHSLHVTAQFNAAGFPAEHVDGDTDAGVRMAAMQRFERGETKVLSNVELFGEGVDVPALEVALLLRPTQSLALFLQQVGRVLRPCEGKAEALILDHAGNCERHGLPDDDREWTLEGRKKKKRSATDAAPIRTCPSCFAAMNVAATACKFCGHVFEIKPREVEQRDGELVEVDRKVAQLLRKSQQAKAQTLEDLVAIGHARGMKNPFGWAGHVWAARQKHREAARV